MGQFLSACDQGQDPMSAAKEMADRTRAKVLELGKRYGIAVNPFSAGIMGGA